MAYFSTRKVVIYNDIRYSFKVILSFRNAGTADIFNGIDSKVARNTCPENVLRVVRRKLDQINQAAALRDLVAPPGNWLEPLLGDRLGQHSIRVNERFRICFVWTENGVLDVEIVDYH